MKFANLILLKDGEGFEYKVGYEYNGETRADSDVHYTSTFLPTTNTNVIHFFDQNTTLNHTYNTWSPQLPQKRHKLYLPSFEHMVDEQYHKYISDSVIFYDTWNDDTSNIPVTFKTCKISVFFPRYSLETNNNGIKYAFNIYIWVNGFKVILGSYLLNRFNAAARTSDLKELSDHFEEISIDVIDPKSLIYDDEWKVFRETICKERNFSNYVGTALCFDLEPVEYDEETNQYLNIISCSGGRNSIVLEDKEEDEMYLSINHNNFKDSIDDQPFINCKLNFNNSYTYDMDGLKEYLMETYNVNVEDVQLSYDLSLRNEDDIYFYNSESGIKDLSYKFYNIDEISMNDFERISWEWIDTYEQQNSAPLYLQAMCNIYIKSNADEDFRLFLYFKSNSIPFTQILCSYFVSPRSKVFDQLDDFWSIKKVNLQNLDMNYYSINAVNKTENIIKHFDYVSQDSKSNIVQPIFYQTQPLSSLTIHRSVNENIAINLDQYKSKVKRFKLKIGNALVYEAGRVKTGIIFIVKANQIAGIDSAGVYYVLNENNDVITSGNYTCV